MSKWKRGDIAFQPTLGVVGRVVELSTLDDDVERAVFQVEGGPPTETLKLEGGDELIAKGCLRGTLAQLQFHDSTINTVKEALQSLSVFAQALGLSPQTAVAIMRGVFQRQSALLQQGEGSNDHQGKQGLPDRG